MNSNFLTGTGLVVALALFLGINIIANQTLTSQRLDVTADGLHTLSDGTRNILKAIDEPITIRYYFSAKQFTEIPEFATYGKRVRDLLEEYVAASGGKIRLLVIDPEPFSEAEDQAAGFGVQSIPLSANGEKGYLGLVGTNSVDDEIPIPALSPEREGALEYDLTKMVYNLSNPTKRVIGLLSGLPVVTTDQDPSSGRPSSREWAVITLLREVYEIRELDEANPELNDEIDTLVIIHPKAFSDKALYAIDQFVIKGGRAVVFVDPFAEADRPERDPNAPMTMPLVNSTLEPIFAKWGVVMDPNRVAADIDAAVRVSFGSDTGPSEVEYLPWLQLTAEHFNSDDFITTELNSINVGSAGALTQTEGATTTFTPLIQTGPNSGMLERDAIVFVRDPRALLENFEPSGGSITIAARISGVVETAYPDGKPLDELEAKINPAGDPGFTAKSAAPINVIVVADTDILSDRFWVRFQNFLGMQMPQAIANNADLLINGIDNLGGNDDLISLRSRGEYSRPFTVVQKIRRDAESQFRNQERALQAKLKETETKMQELQQRDEGGNYLVSPEQRIEIDSFRREQLKTRKELRAVQHDLQKNIEKLGSKLKFINIGLIPILISIFAIGISVYRSRHQNTN
jgi:ABC-type uncharacterized transport system involved in gliding motility auxiliary subunit